MKQFFSRLKLTWFDDCCRVGEFVLVVALALTLIISLHKSFGMGACLWLFGAVCLYVMPKNRGSRYARKIKYNGYCFKVWQGYSGRWCWQSDGWPFLEQHANENAYDAKVLIDSYVSASILPRRDAVASPSELRKRTIFEAFRKWVNESELGWSPRINELMSELNYWRDGDDTLLKEAAAHYENKRRIREEVGE